MRSICSIAIAGLASFASAQSLSTLSAPNNQGNVGNNIYFNLHVNHTLTINTLDDWTAPQTAPSSGSVDIYLGPTTYVGNTLNQSLWTLVATTSAVTAGNSTSAYTLASGMALNPPLCLGPGDYGVALKSVGYAHAYTNGVSCSSTTIPGSCSNSLFSNADLVLAAGANQNSPWISGLNQPRVFNGTLYYTLGGTPVAIASWQTYGNGCYSWYHSFYETYLNPSTSFDLKATSGTNSLGFVFLGTGYLVGPWVSGTGNYYTPTAAATNLSLPDDGTGIVPLPWPFAYPTPGGVQTTTSLEVCSNGFISPGATNGISGQPTVSSFLAGNPRYAPAWFDFDPSMGGQVNYELDPSGATMYVTWVNVPDFGVTGSMNNMQVAFNVDGSLEYRYGSMSLAQGGTFPCLAGWTPGANVLDPGLTDITMIAAPFSTGPTDNPPLSLALSIRPQLGTTPLFGTGNIPTGTFVGVLLMGFTQFSPGVELSVIGMPNCYENIDASSAITNAFFPSGSSASISFPIPNLPIFNGTLVYGQSVTLTPGYNNFGALTSNGVRMVVGTL